MLVGELIKVATVVKLNDEERVTLADAVDLPGSSIERFAGAMAARYRLRGVCMTQGPAGAALLLDDVYRQAAAPRVGVIDTVGAGDAFAAGLAHGMLHDRPVSEIPDVATRLGALVAWRAGGRSPLGTSPRSGASIRQRVDDCPRWLRQHYPCPARTTSLAAHAS